MAGFVKGVLSGLVLVAVAFAAAAYLVPPPAGDAPVEPGEIEATGDPALDFSPAEETPPPPVEPAPEDPTLESAGPGGDGTDSGVLQAPDAPIAPVAEGGELDVAASDATDPDAADAPDQGEVGSAAPDVPVSEPPGLASEGPEADAAPGAGIEVMPEAEALAAERGGMDVEDLQVLEDGSLANEFETANGQAATPSETLEAEAPDMPAWQRHAATFDAPGEGALYAVIAIDAPAEPQAEARLMRMTAPVTVALDPADPDAPRRAEGYRSVGHEVAILAGGEISAGALSAQIDALPEAVAWIAPPGGGWSEGTAGQALVAALDAAGLALVLWDDGPEPRPEGVPVARMLAADAPVRGREGALDLLDRAAEAAGGGQVVAVPGRAAHPSFLPAVMQRAGRATEAPGEPAPLSAALAAAGE